MDPDFADVGKPKRGLEPSAAHWLILGVLLALFMLQTFRIVRSGSASDVRERPQIVITPATITGPFVGAIARRGQACCLASSVSIAAIAGPVLALGLIAQVVPLPLKRGQHAVRLVFWTLGWLVWFLGGQVSFLHAFS
jgi:hypothetical protein